MYTLLLGELMMEQSLRRDAPSISAASLMMVFVISLVFTILTQLPMVPRSGMCSLMSSSTRRRMASFTSLSRKCFTMNAAN